MNSNQSLQGQGNRSFCRAEAAPLGESGGAVSLRPAEKQALGKTLAAAQFRNAVLALQSRPDDPVGTDLRREETNPFPGIPRVKRDLLSIHNPLNYRQVIFLWGQE
jgi:hypothetical protein